MMSLLMEQLINLTDTIFHLMGHGRSQLGASALAGMYYITNLYARLRKLQSGTASDDCTKKRRRESPNETFWQGMFLSDHAVDTDVHILQTLFPDTLLRTVISSDQIYLAVIQIHKLAGL